MGEKTQNECEVLLAVDLGMKAGLAWFDSTGKLLRARSTHFANRTVLKRALPSIWAEVPGVRWAVLEGMGILADIWLKSAEKCGIIAERICAEDWRKDVLIPRQMRSGKEAKATAESMAAAIARECGCPPKTGLGDDTAEAILFGRWYAGKYIRKS